MFNNFLRVLGKGKPAHILLLKLWEDLEGSDICVMGMPEVVGLDWLRSTDWYKQGGWREVRAAAYGPIGEQLDMQYHGELTEHQRDVKATWPKPSQ